MNVQTLPTQTFSAGVRCAERSYFEDRHPRIRFMTAPEGGDGGANGGGTPPAGEGENENEALGEGGKKALESERSARKAAESQIAELAAKVKAFEDGKLTADEKLQRDADEFKGKAGELEAKYAALELENARLLIGVAEKVPAEWIGRIQGATPEEMTADAKKIRASLRDEGERTPGVGELGGNNSPESTPGFGRMRDAYAATK